MDELKKNSWEVSTDIDKLKIMYETALLKASNLRKTDGKCTWGESIFSRVIYDHMPLDIECPHVTEINKDTNDKNIIFHPTMENIQEFKESLPRVNEIEFINKIYQLQGEKSYMIVNRFGESFLILPVFGTTEFYVFDSHSRDFGIFTKDNLIKYIKVYENSYNFIIWIKGYMTDNKLSENLIKRFFYNNYSN